MIKKLPNYFSRKGFTLVEMMVAIAVFSIVMVVAVSALLSVIDANQKAQAIKTAINNVNLALESISKDMRVGTNYTCVDNGGVCDLTNGNEEVSYNRKDDNGATIQVSYRFVPAQGGAKGKVQREKGAGTGFKDITSQEVDIEKMTFFVLNDNTATPDNKEQPRVVITLSGKAGTKQKIQTTFDLQTSVSQRSRSNN